MFLSGPRASSSILNFEAYEGCENNACNVSLKGLCGFLSFARAGHAPRRFFISSFFSSCLSICNYCILFRIRLSIFHRASIAIRFAAYRLRHYTFSNKNDYSISANSSRLCPLRRRSHKPFAVGHCIRQFHTSCSVVGGASVTEHKKIFALAPPFAVRTVLKGRRQ